MREGGTKKVLKLGMWTAVLWTALAAVPSAWTYPRIETARHSDPIFKQQQAAIEEYYQQGGDASSLVIYRYKPEGTANVIGIAARFGLPYSAVASLNRLSRESPVPDELLIPSIPGLFVPLNPESDTEVVIAERRAEELSGTPPITVNRSDATERFYFLPGRDFDRIERLSYLGILFRRPVRNTEISSHYGYRRSPFTGKPSFHSGADFTGPTGTEVLAARGGEVVAVGVHEIYGRFVRLRHENGYETFYGHLNGVNVELNQRISSGMLLGRIGNTGLSTGPHLHFEIRLNGESRDPVRYLPGLEG